MSEIKTPPEVASAIRSRISIADLGRKFFPGWIPRRSCHSPFREDKEPSCSIYIDLKGVERFKDFGAGDGGDVFDFYQKAAGCDRRQAFLDLKEMAFGAEGVPKPAAPSKHSRHDANWRFDSTKQRHHPDLDAPTSGELKELSESRSIGLEGLRIAVSRGLLWTTSLHHHHAWLITDVTRKTYLARRLDGKVWDHLDSKPKAWLLKGSRGNWPIGIMEAKDFPVIALTEGAPDFLAAFAHAWTSQAEARIAPVCMTAASCRIPDEALEFLKGKRVRIFVHNDQAGYKAGQQWHDQLTGIAEVDGFSFDGLTQSDGSPVADLNDLLRVDADCWENHRQTIEEVMSL